MAFRYRYNLVGDSVVPCKDYKLNAAYAAVATVGDVVRLDASGELVRAMTGDTTVLGVLDGMNFEGLNKTVTTGKVRIAPTAVYEADYVGAGALTKGVKYGLDNSGAKVDTADTTTTIVQIVDVVDGKPYVVIAAPQVG